MNNSFFIIIYICILLVLENYDIFRNLQVYKSNEKLKKLHKI